MAAASRRGIVVALLAAPAAKVIPAAAGVVQPDPDARLRALVAELARADAEADQAGAANDEAGERFQALGGRPPIPEALFARPGDVALCIYATDREDGTERPFVSGTAIDHLRRSPRVYGPSREPWQESQVRADEIVAASDAREAERKRREEASGLSRTWSAYMAAVDAAKAARRAVILEPARTMNGAMLKARALFAVYWHDPDELRGEIEHPETSPDHALALSIVRDLLNLGGASA